MRTKHLKVLIHIRKSIRVRLVPSNMFKPVVFTDHSKAVLLLWILCVIILGFMSVMLSCLFLAALCSPAGQGRASYPENMHI